MPSIKTLQPLYRKLKNGTTIKAGFSQVKIITNKDGEVLKATVLKTKIYK